MVAFHLPWWLHIVTVRSSIFCPTINKWSELGHVAGRLLPCYMFIGIGILCMTLLHPHLISLLEATTNWWVCTSTYYTSCVVVHYCIVENGMDIHNVRAPHYMKRMLAITFCFTLRITTYNIRTLVAYIYETPLAQEMVSKVWSYMIYCMYVFHLSRSMHVMESYHLHTL